MYSNKSFTSLDTFKFEKSEGLYSPGISLSSSTSSSSSICLAPVGAIYFYGGNFCYEADLVGKAFAYPSSLLYTSSIFTSSSSSSDSISSLSLTSTAKS